MNIFDDSKHNTCTKQTFEDVRWIFQQRSQISVIMSAHRSLGIAMIREGLVLLCYLRFQLDFPVRESILAAVSIGRQRDPEPRSYCQMISDSGRGSEGRTSHHRISFHAVNGLSGAGRLPGEPCEGTSNATSHRSGDLCREETWREIASQGSPGAHLVHGNRHSSVGLDSEATARRQVVVLPLSSLVPALNASHLLSSSASSSLPLHAATPCYSPSSPCGYFSPSSPFHTDLPARDWAAEAVVKDRLFAALRELLVEYLDIPLSPAILRGRAGPAALESL